jgi:hypothetical protein
MQANRAIEHEDDSWHNAESERRINLTNGVRLAASSLERSLTIAAKR